MNNSICKEHSGFNARLDEVEKQTYDQWKEIDGMKKFVIGTLIAAIFNLVGVIVILSIHLARASGGG